MLETNKVNWFEIPVSDMVRAKNYYSSVFQCTFSDYRTESRHLAVFLPFVHNGTHAAGCLVKAEGESPSTSGTMVYFLCDDVNNELAMVEPGGGKILQPKTDIGELGFMAVMQDCESNRIGLNSFR